MTRLAVVIGLGLLAGGAGAADQPAASASPTLSLLGVERVKKYRDLEVKDPKKQDLAVVRVQVRWSAEVRHVLVKDDDLKLRDAAGRDYECLLHFVQASAPLDDAPGTLEIPFAVRVEAQLVSLRIGKTTLPLAAVSPAATP